MFRPDQLKQAASERTQLTDYGDDSYEEGLRILCQSLNHDARLNAFGRASASDYLQNGIEPGNQVAFGLERSLDLITAMLGILKAGCAYVPLDPNSSQERLDFLVQDSGAALVLAHSRYGDFFSDCGSPIEWMDRVRPEIQRQGSNCAFDASTFEIWGTLLNGARVFIVQKDIMHSPQQLSECIHSNEITVLFLTTAPRILQQRTRRIDAASIARVAMSVLSQAWSHTS